MSDLYVKLNYSPGQKSSYIYVIILEKIIYVGETHRFPLIRWYEHFEQSGFYSKLFYFFSQEELNEKQFHIFGFTERNIKNMFSDYRSYIFELEWQVQRKILSHSYFFRNGFEVISNVNVPSSQKYKIPCESRANSIIKILISELNAL